MNIAWRIAFAPDGADGGGAPAPGGAPAGGTGLGSSSGAPPAGGGSQAPAVSFADSLPEDIRGDAVFKDIKDLGGLAKSYMHASKLIGTDPTNVLRLPAADDEGGWNGIYDKLGRPPSADKYQLTEVKLPEGAAIDTRMKDAFLTQAHQHGLSNKQADQLFQWYVAEQTVALGSQAEARAAAIAAGDAALRAVWPGAAFEENKALANAALAHYGSPELIAELEKSDLGVNPETAKMFAKLGKQLAEDGVIGRGGPNNDRPGPTEAKQQIDALQKGADPAWRTAYMDRNHPDHKAAVERMTRLQELAYPPA